MNMRDVLGFLTFSKALAHVTTFTAGILSRPFVRSRQNPKPHIPCRGMGLWILFNMGLRVSRLLDQHAAQPLPNPKH